MKKNGNSAFEMLRQFVHLATKWFEKGAAISYSPDQLLTKVLDFCRHIVSTFIRGHSTYLNEYFHSVKAKFLPKNFNVGNTSDIRVYALILQFNNPINWINDLYTKFHSMSASCL